MTEPATAAAATTSPRERRGRRFAPTRPDLRDVAFAAVLGGLGVYGFRSSFGGGEELSVGIPAVIVGVGVGYLLAKVRPQLLVGAVMAVAGFFAFGGVVALRADAIAGVLPVPDVVTGLVDGTLNGWVRLLTTVPPAGQAGKLLAIPYLVGYAAGLLGVVLALRWPRWPLCLLPSVLALGLGILFGIEDPVSLLLQGGVFAALAVVWLALRSRAGQAVAPVRAGRLAGAGVMLAVVVLGAFLVGPALPGAGDNERYLLREQIDPPFDPSQYPSPLARYRDFDGEQPIEDVLFTVEGLPEGEVVRFAVMDDYDGYVWRASPPASSKGGTYQRVGDQIGGAATGPSATVRFEMGALADPDSVWIPTAGSPTAIRFEGSAATDLEDAYRFNRWTETSASPRPLRPGDSWTVEATFPDEAPEEGLLDVGVAATVPVSAPPGVTDEISTRVSEWAVDASGPFAATRAVMEQLRSIGAFNNGTFLESPVPAGHSLARLVPFLTADQPQGNGEQYAAAVAYAAEAAGVPARVVLEFGPFDSDGRLEVRAEDVRTSVEIALDGAGWVSVGDPTPPEDQLPEPEVQLQQETPTNEVQPPPPTTQPPPNELPEEQERDETSQPEADEGSGLLATLAAVAKVVAVVAIPLVVICGPLLVIVWLKARRRRRRRSDGSSTERVAGGWEEVVDVARDVGVALPAKGTRTEVAASLPAGRAVAVASEADAGTFGPVEPSEADIERLWAEVASIRGEMLGSLSRWKRLRASVSLASLRRRR